MYMWIFKKVGWKFFAVGAATAVVGAKYVRPVAISLVKTGMDVSESAANTWNQAKAQGSQILTEASTLRGEAVAHDGDVSSLLDEIRALRADVAAVKADLDAKVPA